MASVTRPAASQRHHVATSRGHGATLALLVTLAAQVWLPMAANAAERGQELLNRTLALSASPNRGGQVYAKVCAGCHGDKAWGDGDSSIPALAGQRERYLLLQLIDFAEVSREAAEMHRVDARLGPSPEQQWRDIAAYLSGLAMNPRPQQGDGKSLDVGSGIYRDNCASCHGEEGNGDDTVFSPALAGQHYSYLLRQIRGMATGHRFSNVDFDLALMLDNMSAADMAAVADYISRLSTMPTAARVVR
jgi:cytochrome c553